MVGKRYSYLQMEMSSILCEHSGVITVAFNNYFSAWKMKSISVNLRQSELLRSVGSRA